MVLYTGIWETAYTAAVHYRLAAMFMRTLVFTVIGTAFFSASLANAQNVFRFSAGAGEVTLPAHYERVDDKDASLVVVTKPEGNVRLYFDLHKLDAAVRVRNPGEAVVREQAQKKNRKLYEIGNKVGFMDPTPDTVRNGRSFINFHWQVGFGKTMVVMSALIPRDARDAPDVKRFLSGELEDIIETLRRVGG